jgi:uncharacterized membrane protein YtjA (UPF0391 family)
MADRPGTGTLSFVSFCCRRAHRVKKTDHPARNMHYGFGINNTSSPSGVTRVWSEAGNRFGSTDMLGYAILFLVIALIAGALGFGVVGGMAYGAAKIFFFVFLVLAVLTMVRGRRIAP